jgi:hypothetical protein
VTKTEHESIAVCRDVGLTPLQIEYRGKHWAVVCEEGKLFCPATPSDRRYLQNLKRSAKRLLAKAA